MNSSRAQSDRQRLRIQRSSLNHIRRRLDRLADEAAQLRKRITAFIQRDRKATLPFRSSK